MIKKITVLLLKIIISSALVIFLLLKLGAREIGFHFFSANIWWITLAIIMFSISNLLGSIQWFWLMKSVDIRISLPQAISYYHVGLFFNNFLIGNIGGDAIRIYDSSRISGDMSKAISTVFFDRLIGFVMLTTLALIAGLVWRNIFHSGTIIVVIMIIFICWVISFILLFNEQFARKLGWLIGYVFPPKINSKIREVYNSLNSLKHNKMKLVHVTIFALFIQTLRILVHYFAALSVGVNIHVKYFFIFIPIVALLSSLPISIGGIGIRESSGVALFSQINSLPPESIVATEFLSYVIGIISTIPGGIIFMFRHEKLEQVP